MADKITDWLFEIKIYITHYLPCRKLQLAVATLLFPAPYIS